MATSRAATVLLLCTLPAGAQGQPPALVDVAPVVEETVAVSRRFVGTVRPRRISIVGSEANGRVIDYPLREGQRVKKGDVLAKLDPTALGIRMRAAQAEMKLRQVMLAELKNGSRPEEIAEAKAVVARVEAEIELRKWRHESAAKLFRNQTISEDEVKETLYTLRAAEARLVEARSVLALTEQGPRKERVLQAEVQVEIRKAEVDRLADELTRLVARAPFDGYVVKTSTELGQRVSAGDPIATLAELDRVEVVVPVPTAAASRLRTGGPVTVSVASLPANQSRFTGTLVAIVPLADERGRTIPVRVLIKNRVVDGVPVLKAGTLALAILPVGDAAPTLLVPKDAIVLGGAAPIVYVVGPDNAAMPVAVVLGAGHGTRVAVTGNLQAGAQVVVRGNERLHPGRKIQVRKR